MKRKILIISILAGALLLTAGGITGFLIFNANAQEEEENEKRGKAWSPEIYFHVEGSMSTDVNIYIEDGVTLTLPEVENGKYASWRNVKVDANGLITYENGDHQYLY
jgi:flagellar basal body-associated protein FliL